MQGDEWSGLDITKGTYSFILTDVLPFQSRPSADSWEADIRDYTIALCFERTEMVIKEKGEAPEVDETVSEVAAETEAVDAGASVSE